MMAMISYALVGAAAVVVALTIVAIARSAMKHHGTLSDE